MTPLRELYEYYNYPKAATEERRRARRNGAADRQLISVTDDSKGADKHAKK